MLTNDELKKKIVKVLQELRTSKPIVPNDYGLQIISCMTDREIADAIIAAGIGDVKEAEHRRKVAERALLNYCKRTISFPESVAKNELEKAEKELAEEKR